MDFTFEHYIMIIKEFLKGRNIQDISVRYGFLEDDLIDYEEMIHDIKTLEEAWIVFGDTLIDVASDMLHDGSGIDFIPEHISKTFKMSEEITKEVIQYESLFNLFESWHDESSF